MIPFITGEKIYLRGLQESDAEGNYLKWFNDPDVCQYNAHHIFPYDKESLKSYIKSVSGNKQNLVLAMVYKENDEHIGNISIQSINYLHRNGEFAIILGEKNYWGKGLSKEAAFLIIKHGFIEMNLHRIHCGTAGNNIPMQKLADYLGMKEEGRRREAHYKNGKYFDIVEYGILREEFLSKFDLNQ